MLKNFGSNFKALFENEWGRLSEYHIAHILESWNKYNLCINNNTLIKI